MRDAQNTGARAIGALDDPRRRVEAGSPHGAAGEAGYWIGRALELELEEIGAGRRAVFIAVAETRRAGGDIAHNPFDPIAAAGLWDAWDWFAGWMAREQMRAAAASAAYAELVGGGA
jgi:hypothetical protein